MSSNLSTLNLINSKTPLHVKSKTNNQTNEKELYTFNKLNQLTSYTKQNKNNQTILKLNYKYDVLNRRVQKKKIEYTIDNDTNQTTNKETITKYLYDQNSNIIALLDKDNKLKATIIHNDSIDTPLAIINHKTNKTYYYNKNHLNTILFLTDDNQNIVEEFTYKNAYGEIKEYTIHEQTLNPYSYTSRENDTDTLYYYRARYYDPTIKMFISEDPIRYDSGDFNWYRYVGNEPVNLVDPSGLHKKDKWYGYNNRHFQDWFHKCWKKSGNPDANKEEIQQAYAEWLRTGSPKYGKCSTPPDQKCELYNREYPIKPKPAPWWFWFIFLPPLQFVAP